MGHLRIIKDNQVDIWFKAVAFGALAYFISPWDVIPDTIPGLGFLDDAVVVAAAVSYYLSKN